MLPLRTFVFALPEGEVHGMSYGPEKIASFPGGVVRHLKLQGAFPLSSPLPAAFTILEIVTDY